MLDAHSDHCDTCSKSHADHLQCQPTDDIIRCTHVHSGLSTFMMAFTNVSELFTVDSRNMFRKRNLPQQSGETVFRTVSGPGRQPQPREAILVISDMDTPERPKAVNL